jgi:hypothetical protein
MGDRERKETGEGDSVPARRVNIGLILDQTYICDATQLIPLFDT